MKILNANHFTGNTFILNPFNGAENRFSISRLVCATELAQYTTNGKVLDGYGMVG